MKVLIVNTSERAGGAAVAAGRLMDALNNNGVKAKMLVRDKDTARITVVGVKRPWFKKWHFLWERLCIFVRLHFKRDNLFAIDTGSSGIDITRTAEFREADVIHLHWVNQGMLSLKGIRKILLSGKPVVWTMHDIWPATAICHLTLTCRRFTTGCQQCRYLPHGGSDSDFSSAVWRRKQQMLQGQDIAFVACSHWLEDEAKASALLRGMYITSIPNPIDMHIFCPGDRRQARQEEGLPQDDKLILFVCQRVTNAYKGMDYLAEACRLLAEEYPQMKGTTTVVLLGSNADEVANLLPFKAVTPGYVSDERRMVRLYRAADIFVLPSLSENLPNTIMEAMACGTPCVGFRVGGIPEMIDHKRNGYVAAYRDANDLAAGIHWTLSEACQDSISHEAVKKVAHSFSQSSVSVRYSEIYQQAMAQKHLKL